MGLEYVPNEVRFRIQIPVRTIFVVRGEGFYEETLEDQFAHPLLAHLAREFIDHTFDYNAFSNDDAFGMELRVDGSKFKGELLIDLLVATGITQGMLAWRQEYANWVCIYGDRSH